MNTVEMRGQIYSPADLTISMGSVVTWINQDNTDHTVTSDGGLFDSGTIMPGGRFLFTFESPGVYSYHCQIHPTMKGIIRVTEGLPGGV